jgi:ATP-binding cassette subfamily B (MDR/TAP) protein 1
MTSIRVRCSAISDSIEPICLVMFSFAFNQSVEYSFLALGFWYGCRLVASGELEMVGFFTTFLSVFLSGQQASILFGFSGSMTKATNAANYVFWLQQLEPTIQESDKNRNVHP